MMTSRELSCRGFVSSDKTREPSRSSPDHHRVIGHVALHRWRRYLSIIAILVLSVACTPTPRNGVIHLSALQPLPNDAQTEKTPLRLAVASVISPTGTLDSYASLLEYLGAKLDRPVELIQRRTYAETNGLIERGEADLAFVCTSSYVAGHDDFGMELLAAPMVNGETVYYSLLIVPASSSASSLEDLRGKRFAYTDPLSNSGRLYPTWLVMQLGEKPEDFFSSTFFTYSHDSAIRAVADQLADGAAVDSLVYNFLLARNPSLADQIRIIHRSPAFGIPPVVVGPNIRPQLKALLQDLLTSAHEDPRGRQALDELDVDRFVILDDSAYDGVRALVDAIGVILDEQP